MSVKRLLVIAIFVAIVVGIGCMFAAAEPVRAQCGEPKYPLCVDCHAEQASPGAADAWHSTHQSKATCINCHGGNGTAAGLTAAHAGMLPDPLSDIYTSCRQCHPQDYQTVASGYATTLNVTPGSCATPTPVAMGSLTGGSGSSSGNANFNLPASTLKSTATLPQVFWIIGCLVLLVVFIFGVTWLERHRLGD